MELVHHFAVYGIKPTSLSLVDRDGEVYDLHTIPKVKNHYIGVRSKDGKTVVAFIRLSSLEDSLEEATKHPPHNRSTLGLTRDSFIDERTTIRLQDFQEWVNIARGFQPPVPQSTFYEHPPLSTDYSEISDF